MKIIQKNIDVFNFKTTRRNIGLDIIRTIALITVFIYHTWVLTGNINISPPPIATLLSHGGEIAVTLFFILSGFVIFMTIDKMKKNNTYSYKLYMVRRLKRIMPAYLFCIIILTCLTQAKLGTGILKDFLAHAFMVHNLFGYSGTINGALWTMAIITQFYIIAPFIYTLIKKSSIFTLILSIVVTVILTWLVYTYLYKNHCATILYLAYGRELPTAIDNFVWGMVFAKLYLNFNFSSIKNSKILLYTMFLICFITLDMWCLKAPLPYGGIAITKIMWHSILAIPLAVIVYVCANLKLNEDSSILKPFLYIANYEYEIYLWHLPLIGFAVSVLNGKYGKIPYRYQLMVFLLAGSLSIVFGVANNKMLAMIDMNKIYEKKDLILKRVIYFFVILVILIYFPTLNTFKSEMKSISSNTDMYIHGKVKKLYISPDLISNFKNIMDKYHFKKYIYVDDMTKSTPYLTYYAALYQLAPAKTVFINISASQAHWNDEIKFAQYLQSNDYDCLIVRQNDMLEKLFGIKINPEIGVVFKINKNAGKNLKQMLTPVY